MFLNSFALLRLRDVKRSRKVVSRRCASNLRMVGVYHYQSLIPFGYEH
jgi:hypothetical protein